MNPRRSTRISIILGIAAKTPCQNVLACGDEAISKPKSGRFFQDLHGTLVIASALFQSLIDP